MSSPSDDDKVATVSGATSAATELACSGSLWSSRSADGSGRLDKQFRVSNDSQQSIRLALKPRREGCLANETRLLKCTTTILRKVSQQIQASNPGALTRVNVNQKPEGANRVIRVLGPRRSQFDERQSKMNAQPWNRAFQDSFSTPGGRRRRGIYTSIVMRSNAALKKNDNLADDSEPVVA